MSGRHRRQDPDAAAPRSRIWAILGVVVAVVLLAVILPLLLVGRDSSTGAGGAPTSSAPAPTTPVPTTSAAPSGSASASGSTSPSPSPAATTPPAAHSSAAASGKPPARPPTLVVRADRGESWLTVTDARGLTRYDGMLRPGHTERFTAGLLRVTIGNAGSVLIEVNGRLQPRGGVGQVLRFTVTPRS